VSQQQGPRQEIRARGERLRSDYDRPRPITHRLQPTTERWDPGSRRAGDEHQHRPATVMGEAVSSRERRSDYGTTTQTRWATRRRRWDSGPERIRPAGSDYERNGSDYGRIQPITERLRDWLADSRLPTPALPVVSERHRRRSQTSGEWMAPTSREKHREPDSADSRPPSTPRGREDGQDRNSVRPPTDYERNGCDYANRHRLRA
jgi:hypothetical protein